MPFTLVAFHDTDNSTTLAALPGKADPHVRVEQNDIYVPRELANLAAAYFVGASLTRAQIASPSLRTLANLDIEPFDVATMPASPNALYDLFYSPRPLAPTEQINALATSSAAAIALALVWLSSGPLAPVTGAIFTVRCTFADALTAYAWTNRSLTFTQTLPEGRYQVVGMRAVSAGLVAARLVFTGAPWRPGCIGCDAVSDIISDIFRNGKLGVWGEFDHDSPPTVDLLSITTDASGVVFLDLIKVA